MADTIESCLVKGIPEEVAISAPGRISLTFKELRNHIKITAEALKVRGIGRNDRVAIVLPNGPEMASAFLSVGSCATTAPLNPAYRADEYDFYLSDLGAKALMVEKDSVSPAVEVAKSKNINIIEIAWSKTDPAGSLS